MKPEDTIGIVIPVHKGQALPQLLDSIFEQCYDSYHIYLVTNGKKATALAERLTKRHYYNLAITIISVSGGVQEARNAGLEAVRAAGWRYFLPCDEDNCFYPGVFAKAVERIGEACCCYWNYKFANERVFQSRPYNAKALETMNYICTTSLWQTSAVTHSFRPELPYFQDWAFAYDNSIGLEETLAPVWVNDFLFSTEISKKTNISGIKGSLAEKAQVFRAAVGLPDHKLVITTNGAPVQAIQRAEILGCDFAGAVAGTNHAWYPNQLRFANWTTVYIMGCFNHTMGQLVSNVSLGYDKHKIIHFIGSDVSDLLEKHTFLELEAIREHLHRPDYTLLTNSPVLQVEMERMGFKTQMVPTPVYGLHRFTPTPLPEVFTVGVYYSDGHNKNYFNPADPYNNLKGLSNHYMLWAVAEAMPHIKFKWFGGKAVFTYDNVEFVGNVPETEMPGLLASCSAYISSNCFDSYQHTTLKAIAAGRYVATTTDIPYTLRLSQAEITHFDKAKAEVIDAITYFKTALPQQPLEESRAWLEAHSDYTAYRKAIYDIVEANDGK